MINLLIKNLKGLVIIEKKFHYPYSPSIFNIQSNSGQMILTLKTIPLSKQFFRL